MRRDLEDLPRPDPSLHQTGSEGIDGNRGQRELRLLEHFGMRPSSDLLDIGCGIGRLAYECGSYLDPGATYTGLDIEPVVIDWLNANYAPRLAGFQFDLLDVQSPRYRPDGGIRPEEVQLPYEDERFDVACAFEVFMHVSLEGVRNYLREIARVLRPGGLAVVTLVAIHPGGVGELEHDGRSYVQIADGVYTLFPRRTNISMAYDIGLFRSALDDAGLDEVGLIKGRVHTSRQRREHIRRTRRALLVAERLAAEGADLAELAKQRPPDPVQPPAPEPEAEIPTLSHNCDLFAARKRTASGPG